MTILHPERFKQSNPCNSDGLFDWDAFTIINGKSCFPRDITPMDIDLNVEVKYQHLIMESKDEDKEIPAGQLRALHSLIDTYKITLVCIWGKLSPTSWSLETRSKRVMPIVVKFGGQITKRLGDIAILDRQPTDCQRVFDFLQEWSAVVDGRRG
jgi:hypothetical protein